MIVLSESEQPLFTEFRKLAPLSRYRASTVAKMAVFHSLAKIQMRIVEKSLKWKYIYFDDLNAFLTEILSYQFRTFYDPK